MRVEDLVGNGRARGQFEIIYDHVFTWSSMLPSVRAPQLSRGNALWFLPFRSSFDTQQPNMVWISRIEAISARLFKTDTPVCRHPFLGS